LEEFGVGCHYWMVLELIFLDSQEKIKNIVRNVRSIARKERV
jgi:hypothetical protein